MTRRLYLLTVLCLSCQTTQRIVALESETKALKVQLQFQAEEKQDLKRQLELMNDRIEGEVKKLYARLNCTNTQVADFIAECESDSELCSPKGAENALLFMITQPYTTLYLIPDLGAKSITLIRKGQLSILADLKNLHPSSRFLILVQPRAASAESTNEALEVGRGVSRYIRSVFAVPRGTRILGPKSLPCDFKAEKLKRYSGRLDLVGPGEPVDPQQRIRVWVFRTDC